MIRIAIIGCGRILNAHLQAYKALRDAGVDTFRITALVERNTDDALMFIKRGEGPTPRRPVVKPGSGDPLSAPHTYLSDFQDDVDVQIFSDYKEMLKDPDIDAVNDFTPLYLHHEIGQAVLSANKHLLTEKPLASSVNEANSLVDLAAANGLVLTVSENVRQREFTRAAGWAVRQGLIGDPQFAFIGSLGGPWSPDKIVANTARRHELDKSGGGGSIDIGVHHFHLLRYVFGPIEWVNAVSRTLEPKRYEYDKTGNVVNMVAPDVDDTYLAVAGFANQAIAQMVWSWGLHGEPLEIPGLPAFYGTKGCIKGGELVYEPGRREALIPRFNAGISKEEYFSYFPFGIRDPFAILQYDWLNAIMFGGETETSGQEGMLDLACSIALQESAKLGQRVDIY